MTYSMKTKKDRRKVYLMAAERIYSGQNINCCCAISEMLFSSVFRHIEALELSPEFELFRPEYGGRGDWWDSTDKGSRIIALLLCAEMCR